MLARNRTSVLSNSCHDFAKERFAGAQADFVKGLAPVAWLPVNRA
jgi:hypothetical protein